MDTAHLIAHKLLEINAIKINLEDPFIWASGWRSPIYCDNRKALAYPGIRRLICDAYTAAIQKYFPSVELIAGVATGAIAQGALIADKLNIPFAYVREKAKDHGLRKIIEGGSPENKQTVVVEDHVSTGGSSLKVIEELHREKATVLGMVATFSYGFDIAVKNFEKAACQLVTLSSFDILVQQALTDNYINHADADKLTRWQKFPDTFFST
jgi:orotate phosphoribosyltransferase